MAFTIEKEGKVVRTAILRAQDLEKGNLANHSKISPSLTNLIKT